MYQSAPTPHKLFKKVMINHANKFLRQNRKLIRKPKLDIETQIFMVLTRLRLGLLEKDLAYRYSIAESTVSKFFSFWINIIHSYMIQIPIWPSRELVQRQLPECFSRSYPSTRVINDTTEINIQKPSDYVAQSSTYSKYKAHNTAKGLIGITPNGFVCFASQLYM